MKVHVLHHGRAICGRPDEPSVWRDDERWCHLAEHDKATCGPCAALAAKAYHDGDPPKWRPPVVQVERTELEGFARDLREPWSAPVEGNAELVGHLKRTALQAAETVEGWLR